MATDGPGSGSNERLFQALNLKPEAQQEREREELQRSILDLPDLDAGPALREASTVIQAAGDGTGGDEAGPDGSLKGIKGEFQRSADTRQRSLASYFEFSHSMVAALTAGANKVAGEMQQAARQMLESLAEGNMDLGRSLSGLGNSLAKGLFNTFGESLVQQGVQKTAQGTSLVIKGKPGAEPLLASGTALAATGLGVKAMGAAFLAEGGLVTKPTLAMVGEGGQSEAVIPLDRLGGAEAFGGVKVGRMAMRFPGVRSLEDVKGGALRNVAVSQFRREQLRARG
jgi:hypothetical protein